MNREYLIQKEDTEILTQNSDKRYNRQLIDAETGFTLGYFPNNWTDEQIYIALRMANRFYTIGIQDGEQSKQSEIKKALGINI